jgi:DNA-binding MarR family transcriptional regulator
MAKGDQCDELVWLLQRAGQRLRAVTDHIAVAHGMSGGLRDYIVLTLLLTARPNTQVELAVLAGVDKTTLMALLDRLEQEGLVERKLDPGNRRVRKPVATPKGEKLQAAVTAARRRPNMFRACLPAI